MKIPLNVGGPAQSARDAQLKTLERDIQKTKEGDWEAKSNLHRTFMKLLQDLAQKRASEPAKVNVLIDAGKEGLVKAARKYDIKKGAGGFQLFALDFIEKQMDAANRGGGLLARLFGGR